VEELRLQEDLHGVAHNGGSEFREAVVSEAKAMTLRQEHQHAASEFRLPADVDWHMLDKSKFFLLGAALFSGVSGMLYPVVVLKTRQQVVMAAVSSPHSCASLGLDILRREGVRAFYKGFSTSLAGTIPARALYMSTLEITKSSVGSLLATKAAGGAMSEPAAAAVANAAAGLTASIAAQLVWTPIDVVSQRLMVQGGEQGGLSTRRYAGGLDAFKKIVKAGGLPGLYRGFGMSILTYAPSNALWWASYCVTQRSVWMSLGYKGGNNDSQIAAAAPPSSGVVVLVQGLSAASAGGISALVTTPFDTIKTRLQVLGNDGTKPPTVMQTVQTLVKEGGWKACYRGLGARWASMSLSATTTITTYEFIKRLSAKAGE
jgi:solute carrier family 25 protein 44